MRWCGREKVPAFCAPLRSPMPADVSAADVGPGQFRDCVSGFTAARR